MYTLFTTRRAVAPRFRYQSFEATRRRWNENIARLTAYWATSGYAVDSQHQLSRLVGSFSIPLYDDVQKYRDAIADLVPQLCMGNQIVAPTNSSIQGNERGWFYGLAGKEYLVSVDFGVPTQTVLAKDAWRSVPALQVLRHNQTDLNFALPNGTPPDVQDGLVILLIDIPLLATQYWCWAREQLQRPQAERERTQQFIGQYVLPNLLWSQANVAWFNRIRATLAATQLAPERKVNAIALATNYTDLDRVAGRLLTDATVNRLTLHELYACIPTIDAVYSLLDFLQLPDTVLARQNQWALEAAYLPYTAFALELASLHGFDQIQYEVNKLHRLAQRVQSDRLFDAAPPPVRRLLHDEFANQIAVWA